MMHGYIIIIQKELEKLPIKAKAISFDAIIDLDDNVLLFNIYDHIDLNSFKKIPYIKAIKIRSFWGNSIMGAKTIHK